MIELLDGKSQKIREEVSNLCGNGDASSGDGWRFRGRGMKQLTGRSNYNKFDQQYKSYWATEYQDFMASPALLMSMPYALRSAIWFWVSMGCTKKADGGIKDTDIDGVTGIVNSGELGTDRALERRLFVLNAYKIIN